VTDSGGEPSHHRGRWPWLVVGVLGVVVVGSIAFASVHRADATRSSATGPTHVTKPVKLGPFKLTALSPLPRATGVDYAAPIVLSFSRPLSSRTPDPTLIPAIDGTWSVHDNVLRFRPSGFFFPSSREQIVIPAGTRARDGARLASPIRSAFRIEPGSILRLQQLLAELGYLPVGFAPAGPGTTASRASIALGTEPVDPNAISPAPRPGQFTWRFAHIPSQLAETWKPGLWNVATQGAVMAFESDHGLTPDGEPGNAVWTRLLGAVATRSPTTRPYDYLVVTETIPETLYVWRDGGVILQTPVNTGVYGASTPLGTWPVYLRFTSTTMKGTNPDGSKYADPGVPWVSYFHGSDAVHGFWRSEFGYPQSDGCVEVPIDNAGEIYPDDPYGTLVTVTTGRLGTELGVSGPTLPATHVVTPPPTTSTTTTSTTTTTTTTTTPARHRTTTTTAPTAPTTTTTAPTTTTTEPTTTSVPATTTTSASTTTTT